MYSSDPFWVNFCIWWELWVKVLLFHVVIQLSQDNLLKGILFCILTFWEKINQKSGKRLVKTQLINQECSIGKGIHKWNRMERLEIVVVQSISRVWLCDPRDCASLSLTISQSLPKFMFIESVMEPSHPLLSLSPLDFNISQHQGFFQ